MQVREARADERERWDAFVLGSPQGSFLQTWEWGVVQEAGDTKIWRLVVEDKGQWQAVLLLVRRHVWLGRCWLYGPWGPVFADALVGDLEIFESLQKRMQALAEDEKAVWVRVDTPFLVGSQEADEWVKTLRKHGWRKGGREVQPAETLLLDLQKSEEELLAGMKSKTRYNVRLAERKEVTVRWSQDVKDIEWFWRLAEEVSGQGRFHYHSREYYEVILENLNTSGGEIGVELGIAEYEGEALAVHMMVYAGERATYLHGASSLNKREVMAPTLLYWETIKRAKARGCLMYDFWGVAPAGAGSDHPWAGVTRIKEGFKGRLERYTGAHDLVMQPWVCRMIEVARRVKKVVT